MYGDRLDLADQLLLPWPDDETMLLPEAALHIRAIIRPRVTQLGMHCRTFNSARVLTDH